MSPHARETRPYASEVKCIIDPATGAAIGDWIRTHLEADPHGAGPFNDEYRTASLYFDTDKGDVFHQRRSFGRSKYRVRRDGTLPYVFLERKLRKPGIPVKRRTTVDIEELSWLADVAPDSGWPGEWFHRRVVLRQIHPVCQLSYARIARFARTIEGPVRLTLKLYTNEGFDTGLDSVKKLPTSVGRFCWSGRTREVSLRTRNSN